MRRVFYSALVLLYLLHNDLWFWHDARLLWGVPVGLAYHFAYCLAAALLMALVVRHAWPGDSPQEAREDEPS